MVHTLQLLFIKIDFLFQGKPLDVSWGKRSCWTCVFVTEQVSILFSFSSIAILNFPWQTHFLFRDPDWLNMEPSMISALSDLSGNSKTPIHIWLCSFTRMANVECHTKKGCTPFHLACKEGHLQISQQLYDKGADTEVKHRFSLV